MGLGCGVGSRRRNRVRLGRYFLWNSDSLDVTESLYLRAFGHKGSVMSLSIFSEIVQ